eukprot:COSAG04_NODE_657_length_11477_cov_17.225962_23_plen_53_part_00
MLCACAPQGAGPLAASGLTAGCAQPMGHNLCIIALRFFSAVVPHAHMTREAA